MSPTVDPYPPKTLHHVRPANTEYVYAVHAARSPTVAVCCQCIDDWRVTALIELDKLTMSPLSHPSLFRKRSLLLHASMYVVRSTSD
jgi:hypothetical protein